MLRIYMPPRGLWAQRYVSVWGILISPYLCLIQYLRAVPVNRENCTMTQTESRQSTFEGDHYCSHSYNTNVCDCLRRGIHEYHVEGIVLWAHTVQKCCTECFILPAKNEYE